MSGSRTKTGCWTCRLRRKKCDEQQPACENCVSRNLECYGYGAKPEWMLNKANWQQILNSDEARAIRVGAEKAYHRRRQKRLPAGPWASGVQIHDLGDFAQPRGDVVALDRTWSNCTQPLRDIDYTPNYQRVQSFVDLIFPLQWGFFDLRSIGRGWLFDTIMASEPMYQASRGLCASFESGLRAGSTSGQCDVTPEVRQSRLLALRGLQPYVTDLQQNPVDETSLLKAVHAIAIILLLSSLEIFGETEGDWEVHQQAAGAMVDLIETRIAAPHHSPHVVGAIGHLLSHSQPSFEIRSLEFFVSTYVWTDIIAESLHGTTNRQPRQFDYLPLLHNGIIDMRSIMGCSSAVMATIKEVSVFAQSVFNTPVSQQEAVATGLALRIQQLGQDAAGDLSPSANGPAAESNWVTTIHALAALVYLRTVAVLPNVALKNVVTRCLETLEAMPPHLLIRICWPFVIAGCMASEHQHSRFHALVRRTEQAGHVLGFTWKAIIVMEECWKLQASEPEKNWNWRSTMEHMGARILLI